MAALESQLSTPVIALAEDTLAPAKVLNLAYSVSQGKVTLTWDPVTTNSDGSPLSDLAGYRVYRKDSAEDTFALVANVAASVDAQVTTYEDTSMFDGASYIYAVSAIDDESTPNEGEQSDELAVKTIPSVPQNLAATSGDSVIRLTWDSVQDSETPKLNENLAGYRIYRKEANDEGQHVFLAQVGADVTLYDDLTAENGVEYSYAVSSIDNSL
jgi:fibronectin type 3 domain-containing protein